ncbi:AAA family ATPase [Herpetosiphon sp. NSE202]|uniref:AAA family ATPase n=1 Tax=Herpetosiphon sp. NSE202 TaxID=3351349 RepID=UPI003642BB58
MQQETYFIDALQQPSQALTYLVNQQLAAQYPDKAILQTQDCDFDVRNYAEAGFCELQLRQQPHPQIGYSWVRGEEGSISRYLENAWQTVTWNDQQFELISMTWNAYGNQLTMQYLIGASQAAVEQFFKTVSAWNTEIRDEIMVFEEGSWEKNQELFYAIKNTSLDNLILPGTLKHDIFRDLQRFFEAKETYANYNIAWKRGIILVGPPGNGKTHMIKGLLNALDYPCLYVKSFDAQYTTNNANIRAVFDRARRSAPCIVVLEDLDSLINDNNRAFFLNEVDGFTSNQGIVLLATTNHPEAIDPAIMNRPSRFDRKYYFSLPELAERVAYIQQWNAALHSSTQLTEAGIQQAAEATDGFSFAYLKELFVSALMRWIDTKDQTTMDLVILEQATFLREQMVTEQPVEEEDEA